MVNLMKNEVGKSSIFREDKKAYIIAEIGLNHNGELQMAKDMITAAAKAGADAVKFQNWKAEDFIVDRSETVTYTSQRKEVTESFFDLCKRNEMKSGWIPILKDYCLDLRTDFISTPTTNEGVDDLINEGIKVIKNGSDYLGHIPLLKYMGQKAEVVIISTGMATLDEIEHAVEVLRNNSCEPTVLHCTSAYPTPYSEANLSAIETIRKSVGCEVGWSDHTVDPGVIHRAIHKWDAKIIEFHLDLDGKGEEFESGHCWLPEQIGSVIKQVRHAEDADGDGIKEPVPSEMSDRLWRTDPLDGLRPFKSIRNTFSS